MANSVVKFESEVFVGVGRVTIDSCRWIPLGTADLDKQRSILHECDK